MQLWFATESITQSVCMKRSSNWMANWALATCHEIGGFFQRACTLRSTSQMSLVAASSLGKWPRTRTEAATIGQQCKVLHLPTVAAQCEQLAKQAARERRTHLGFLEALLQAKLEDCDQRLVERRIREAHLPR